MRKIFSILLSAVIVMGLTSCSDDDNDGRPSVSFKRPVYILESATPVDVEIGLTVPAVTDLLIPVIVSGSAERDVEYTLSADRFEIKAGETSASIQILPLNNTKSGNDIKLQLTEVRGYRFGFYNVAMIPVLPRSILTASFDKEVYELAGETEVTMSLKNGTSKYVKPSSTVKVPFDIDPSSTAELGTHFEIVGGEQVLAMTAKDTAAKVKLRILKQEPGKDKIVLRIHENELFEAGANNRATITIISTNNVADMAGSWLLTGLSNKDQLVTEVNYLGYHGDADNLPANCPATDELKLTPNGNDALTLDISGITGDLKNYLRPATMTKVSEVFEKLYELDDDPEALVATMKTDKVNIPFSATSTRERVAEVGIRVLDNGRSLELRIYQYEPVDFLTRVYAFRTTSTAFGKEPMKQDFTLVYRFNRK